IDDLRKQGAGIFYVSHRLEELGRIADRVTVLRDGALVGTRRMSEVNRTELIRMMVGRELDAIAVRRSRVAPHPNPPPQGGRGPIDGDVILQTQDLGCRASGVSGVSIEVHAGEILGLAGLVGAGRTELAHILFGLTPADDGTILLNGAPVVVDSPACATALG